MNSASSYLGETGTEDDDEDAEAYRVVGPSSPIGQRRPPSKLSGDEAERPILSVRGLSSYRLTQYHFVSIEASVR